MQDLKARLILGSDKMVGLMLLCMLTGAVLAFGGSIWWARLTMAFLSIGLVCLWILRSVIEGKVRILKSPLTGLAVLTLALAAIQIAPLPSTLAYRLSPRSRAIFVESAGIELGRSPVTIDRSATLHWLASAATGLVVFAIASHFTDRIGRLKLVWGSVVIGFGACTILGTMQTAWNSTALYGSLLPGQGPTWAPSLADLQAAPGVTRLRTLRTGATLSGGPLAGEPQPWVMAIPSRQAPVGPMLGGPGAYLALAALALPLAMGLGLQTLAPLGSRESLASRLRSEGGTTKVILLLGLVVVGSGLAGLLGGSILAIPIGLGLGIAGFGSILGSGVRVSALAISIAALSSLAIGVRWGETAERPEGSTAITGMEDLSSRSVDWRDASRIARDFPIFGSGLGSYAAIIPHYKSEDSTPTTAQSSWIQFAAEAGLAGLVLVAIGALWCAWRLPRAISRVGSGDRPLAAALLGSVVAFLLLSVIHSTIQVPAVALAACAVGGTVNRWLAGGTDLFVERF